MSGQCRSISQMSELAPHCLDRDFSYTGPKRCFPDDVDNLPTTFIENCLSAEFRGDHWPNGVRHYSIFFEEFLASEQLAQERCRLEEPGHQGRLVLGQQCSARGFQGA